MREIKFRAWGIDRGKMHDVYNIAFHESYGYKAITSEQPLNVNTTFINKEEFILMQFTGLKDKKGVEIYEGDILKLPTFNNQGWFKKAVVTFEDGSFQCDCNLVSKYNVEHIEVIGNIYENPELLEVSK